MYSENPHNATHVPGACADANKKNNCAPRRGKEIRAKPQDFYFSIVLSLSI
jgi:hypothetical protein